MIQRYCDRSIPERMISDDSRLSAKRAGIEDEAAISDFISHARDEFLRHFEDLAFSRALEEAWAIVARVDKMIADAKPWDLAKDASQRQTLNAVLYRAAEALRWLAVMLYPVMPTSTSGIYQQLGLGDEVSKVNPRELRWGDLKPGTQINEVKALFPRIDKAKTKEEIKQESAEQKSEVREQRSDSKSDSGDGASKGSGQHATEAEA